MRQTRPITTLTEDEILAVGKVIGYVETAGSLVLTDLIIARTILPSAKTYTRRGYIIYDLEQRPLYMTESLYEAACQFVYMEGAETILEALNFPSQS